MCVSKPCVKSFSNRFLQAVVRARVNVQTLLYEDPNFFSWSEAAATKQTNAASRARAMARQEDLQPNER